MLIPLPGTATATCSRLVQHSLYARPGSLKVNAGLHARQYMTCFHM